MLIGATGSLDDTLGRLTSLSDTAGTLESYTYLGLGNIVQRANPASTLTYIDQGDSLANHDGGDRYTGFDRFGRVIDQWWLNTADLSEATPILTTADRFQYGYDRDSNRLSKSNLLDTALSETYTYDNLNRLASMTRGGDAYQSWDLDGLGNMDSVTTGSSTVNRTHNSQNELTSVGANTLAFDANGNTTTDDQGQTLVYDAWNRLVAVKNDSTVLKTYTYDAAGRRITETDASATTTTLFYSSQWQVLETQQSGQTTARYVWSPVYVNALICRDQPTTPGGPLNQRVYVQQDANFNVTALLTYNTETSTWTVALRIAYDSYGNATFYTPDGTLTTNTHSFRVLYQGGWFDSATGLYVFQHRDYSPAMMRWMQQDPAGYVDGENAFEYLKSAPVMRLDPEGLSEQSEQAALKEQVRNIIAQEEAIHHNEPYYRDAGVQDFLAKLWGVAGSIKYELKEQVTAASYWSWGSKMYLRAGFNTDHETVLHELVHALDQKNGWWVHTIYACTCLGPAEKLAEGAAKLLQHTAVLRNVLKKGTAAEAEKEWKTAWLELNKTKDEDTTLAGVVVGEDGVKDIKEKLMNFSCKALIPVYEKELEKKGIKACLEVPRGLIEPLR